MGIAAVIYSIEILLAGLTGFLAMYVLSWPIVFFWHNNLHAYLLFAEDADMARYNEPRYTEEDLLAAARFGGWFGARLGHKRFSHLPRSADFDVRLGRIGRDHLTAVVLLVGAGLVAGLPQISSLGSSAIADLMLLPPFG
jgi:uncharacterized membrane protein YsdA (DUF1294 family)